MDIREYKYDRPYIIAAGFILTGLVVIFYFNADLLSPIFNGKIYFTGRGSILAHHRWD